MALPFVGLCLMTFCGLAGLALLFLPSLSGGIFGLFFSASLRLQLLQMKENASFSACLGV